ncbi:MAG TPA: hypothetical protein VGZ01_07965, partial [Trinickia sp.]|nr:hypothetical protein [Trinickia sp.]
MIGAVPGTWSRSRTSRRWWAYVVIVMSVALRRHNPPRDATAHFNEIASGARIFFCKKVHESCLAPSFLPTYQQKML